MHYDFIAIRGSASAAPASVFVAGVGRLTTWHQERTFSPSMAWSCMCHWSQEWDCGAVGEKLLSEIGGVFEGRPGKRIRGGKKVVEKLWRSLYAQ